MIRILLVGACGRMGRTISSLVQDVDGFKIIGGVDRSLNSGIVTNFRDIDPKKIDVVIDFSSQELSIKTIKWCEKNKISTVCGTTGLNAIQVELFKKASQKIGVVLSPNMSIGIALINEMIKVFSLSSKLDFQIEEIHHRDKKDSPSGTAIQLKNELKKITGSDIKTPASIRGGGVFGIHRIYGFDMDEWVMIEHHALNRKVFAQGALLAAKWLNSRKKIGFFNMQDVLGFSQ